MNRFLRKILKVTAWIIGVILFLLLLVYILIQVPAVQNFAKNKMVAYIEGKIKTKVSIDKLEIAFPKQIVLKGVYFEDQKKDTLLFGKELRIDIALFKLLSHEVDINYLELDSVKTHIYRTGTDSAFNFDYIVKAFSGEQKKQPQPQDTTGALKFHLNSIILKDILATYKDDNTGNDIYFYLGNFEAKINTFDPGKLIFDISKINFKNITARMHRYQPSVVQKQITAPVLFAPSLKLGELSLQNIRLNYADDVAANHAEINIGEFITHPALILPQSNAISLNDILLKNTFISVDLNKKAVIKPVSAPLDTAVSSVWKIGVTKINFDNNDLNYNDNTQPRAKKGMDYNHLHIQHLQVLADSLYATASGYKANIRQVAFNEQSGFNLQKLQTNFSYNDTSLLLQNLLVQTDNTLLRNKIILKYSSLQDISKNPGNLYIDAGFDKCSLSAKDILTFAPQLAANLRGNEQAVIQLNTGIKGFVKDLSIPFFDMKGLGNTEVHLTGNIKGLPDAKNAVYNISIAQLKTTANDIYELVPAKTIPSNIRIPQALAVKGNFKGTAKQFQTLLKLNSSSGNALIKGSMNADQSYTANISLDKFNVGYIIKDTNTGNVSLTATVKGKGFDLKNAVAAVETNIRSAIYKGYDYQNFSLTGNIAHGIADIKAAIKDENISFNLTANADITRKYPEALKLLLQLDTLNFNALHLRKDTLTLHGNITADMPQTNPDSLIGNIAVTGLVVYTPGQKLSTDSITLNAGVNGSQRNLNIRSEFLKADLTGEYKLTEIALALQQTINRYYHLPAYQNKNFAVQNWQLRAIFIPSPIALQLVPAIKGSDSVVLQTSFNSEANNFTASLKTKKIIYNQTQADSITILANTDNAKLNFSADVQNVKSGSYNLYHTAMNGFIANNKADITLDVADKKNKPQYNIAGIAEQINQGIKFSLKPDGLLLDYNKWNVTADNFIVYDSSGILVNDFKINNGAQSFTLNSTAQSANAPLQATFNNFQISTITKIINQDSLLVEGNINGNAFISGATKSPVFTSDLQINTLVYKKDTIGNVSLKVNNRQANAYAADISVQGNKNDVRLNGIYFTGESRMDLKLAINSLNLASLKPFASSQVQDIGGFAKGNLNIAGTPSKPLITGNINFDNAFVIPTVSGERFTISNDAINFAADGIHLNNFTLLDSASNKAIVSGDILTTDFRQYKFNTNIDAQNFTMVNTPQQTNKLFYGKLNIDTHIKLRGDMASPTADATLHINKTTDFTMVLPNSDPEVQEREGIVKFVDKDHPDTVNIKTLYDSLNQSALKGMDVSATITTDSSAKLTLIIDERNGDALTMQGTASLSAGVDKSGKVSLTGNYQLTHGAYQVSLSILKRRFEIQPGSVITWTGDPTSAIVDINAVYYAKTAPIDLVIQQLGGRTQEEITRFKQQLPFQVNLKMQGELLKPIITFDITLPPDELSQWPEVAAKLQQIRTDESELNKQVFAVLLLNRFVQENPFESSAGGTGIADIGRQSASRILSDQLNQLAGSLIKGVDINFDINSQKDYSTGIEQNRTDLNVSVSKKLLNDRLIINVGSDVALEGQSTATQNSSVIGNFSVDYKLSGDGKYRLRAYRKNDYQEIVEGQVVETGLSFILTFDYNYFRELFQSKKTLRKNIQKSKKEQPESTNGGK